MRRLTLILAVLLLGACTHNKPEYVPLEKEHARAKGWTEKGDASWYGHPYHGRKTASGEVYNMYDMTAAHRSLPFQTRVEVKRRDTGEKVIVRITDRGPFIKGRIIDLSFAAAKKIHLDIDGVAPVKLKVIKTPEKKSPPDKEKPTPATPSPPAPTLEAGGCHWIQVGAFSRISNAEKVRKKLRESGYHALIIEISGDLHRVRVGPFDNSTEAHDALDQLRHDWPTAQLVDCGGSRS